jgi:hypothetical protein
MTASSQLHGRSDAFVPQVGQEPGQRRGLGRKNRGVMQSMIRVGSTVFRADPFESHANKNGGAHLEQHKASTYDHVHQMVGGSYLNIISVLRHSHLRSSLASLDSGQHWH